MNVRNLLNHCVLGAILGLLCMPPLWGQEEPFPYPEGQVVEITGAVAHADGSPAVGNTIIFEAFRSGFGMRDLNPRHFGKHRKGLVERTTITDENGRYSFLWSWHEYWNRFEVSVGEFGSEGFEVVARADLSQRILRGTPVRVSFVLGVTSATGQIIGAPAAMPVPPSRRTTTTSGLSLSAAQQGVRDREGAPDKAETLELAYGQETTWWYFSAGRGFRFLDGELSAELTFEPVSN